MELADTSDLIAGIELDVPVRTSNQVFESLFESLSWITFYWLELICCQVVLIGCAILCSEFKLAGATIASRARITCQL